MTTPLAPRPAPTVASVGSLAAVVLAACLLIVVTASVLTGWRVLTVETGSMEPAIRPGDGVLSAPIAPARARTGDVVTFRDPNGADRLLTHRVEAVETLGDLVLFRTRGDAAVNGESWSVAANGHIGRVVARVPGAGTLLRTAGAPPARMILLGAAAIGLAVLALPRRRATRRIQPHARPLAPAPKEPA